MEGANAKASQGKRALWSIGSNERWESQQQFSDNSGHWSSHCQDSIQLSLFCSTMKYLTDTGCMYTIHCHFEVVRSGIALRLRICYLSEKRQEVLHMLCERTGSMMHISMTVAWGMAFGYLLNLYIVVHKTVMYGNWWLVVAGGNWHGERKDWQHPSLYFWAGIICCKLFFWFGSIFQEYWCFTNRTLK